MYFNSLKKQAESATQIVHLDRCRYSIASLLFSYLTCRFIVLNSPTDYGFSNSQC